MTEVWEFLFVIAFGIVVRGLIPMAIAVWIPEWRVRRRKRLRMQLPKAQMLKEK